MFAWGTSWSIQYGGYAYKEIRILWKISTAHTGRNTYQSDFAEKRIFGE